MTLYIPGQFLAYAKIGDSEIPLSSSDDQFICIRDNVKQILPTVEFYLPDFNNVLSGQTLISDGTPIEVAISDGVDGKAVVKKFTSFGTPKRAPTSTGTFLHIIGILDGCADIVRAAVNRSINDTSYNVMSEAAKQFDLNFSSNVTSTNDKMAWRGGRQHWGNFLNFVADHGYSQPGSFMSFSIQSNKTLFYNDVAQLMKSQARKAMIVNSSTDKEVNNVPVFNMIEYLAVNHSGYANNSNAYGMSMKQFNTGTGDIDAYKTSQAHKPTGMGIDMNANIKSSIDKNPRVLLPAINTGNTHENFMSARHQNARLGDTYSQNVYVLVPAYTNLSLYDKVYFRALDEQGNIDTSTVGDYLITGTAKATKAGRYYEKLELTSTGPSNGKGIS